MQSLPLYANQQLLMLWLTAECCYRITTTLQCCFKLNLLRWTDKHYCGQFLICMAFMFH